MTSLILNSLALGSKQEVTKDVLLYKNDGKHGGNPYTLNTIETQHSIFLDEYTPIWHGIYFHDKYPIH